MKNNPYIKRKPVVSYGNMEYVDTKDGDNSTMSVYITIELVRDENSLHQCFAENFKTGLKKHAEEHDITLDVFKTETRDTPDDKLASIVVISMSEAEFHSFINKQTYSDAILPMTILNEAIEFATFNTETAATRIAKHQNSIDKIWNQE